MHKINRILIFIFLNLSLLCFGQNDSSNYKNSISINVAQLFIDNIRISYDHQVFKRQNIIFEVGYQPGFLNYSNKVFKGFDNVNIYTYKGFNFSLGYKYFLKKHTNVNKQYFLSAMSVYGRKYRNNFLGIGGSDGIYGYGLYDASQVFKELKFVFGKTRTGTYKNIGSFFEWYIGLGLIERKSEIISYGQGIEYEIYHNVSQVHFNYYPKPIINNKKILIPQFCFGIKWGIAF